MITRTRSASDTGTARRSGLRAARLVAVRSWGGRIRATGDDRRHHRWCGHPPDRSTAVPDPPARRPGRHPRPTGRVRLSAHRPRPWRVLAARDGPPGRGRTDPRSRRSSGGGRAGARHTAAGRPVGGAPRPAEADRAPSAGRSATARTARCRTGPSCRHAHRSPHTRAEVPPRHRCPATAVGAVRGPTGAAPAPHGPGPVSDREPVTGRPLSRAPAGPHPLAGLRGSLGNNAKEPPDGTGGPPRTAVRRCLGGRAGASTRVEGVSAVRELPPPERPPAAAPADAAPTPRRPGRIRSTA